MFYQIFLSQQVKRWAIITYKQADSQVARNMKKVSKLHRIVAQCPLPPQKKKNSANTSKKTPEK